MLRGFVCGRGLAGRLIVEASWRTLLASLLALWYASSVPICAGPRAWLIVRFIAHRRHDLRDWRGIVRRMIAATGNAPYRLTVWKAGDGGITRKD
jgi:hypothetical protein